MHAKLVDRFKTEADKLESLLDHNGGSAEKHASTCVTR